jgi:hypothetical protein
MTLRQELYQLQNFRMAKKSQKAMRTSGYHILFMTQLWLQSELRSIGQCSRLILMRPLNLNKNSTAVVSTSAIFFGGPLLSGCKCGIITLFLAVSLLQFLLLWIVTSTNAMQLLLLCQQPKIV